MISIEKDKKYFIPILQQALRINPKLKFVATPWSAPGWMKWENTLYGSGQWNTSKVKIKSENIIN